MQYYIIVDVYFYVVWCVYNYGRRRFLICVSLYSSVCLGFYNQITCRRNALIKARKFQARVVRMLAAGAWTSEGETGQLWPVFPSFDGGTSPLAVHDRCLFMRRVNNNGIMKFFVSVAHHRKSSFLLGISIIRHSVNRCFFWCLAVSGAARELRIKNSVWIFFIGPTVEMRALNGICSLYLASITN